MYRPGKLLIGECGFAFLSQVIARERDHVAAVALQNDRRVRHREYPVVVLVRLRSAQQRDAFERRLDLGRRDAPFIECSFRLLDLQLALGVGEALFLLEDFLLVVGGLLRSILGVELLDASLIRRLGIGEIPLEAAREADRPAGEALHHQALDLRIVQSRGEVARQVPDVLFDLG